jgi:hypothetical protein
MLEEEHEAAAAAAVEEETHGAMETGEADEEARRMADALVGSDEARRTTAVPTDAQIIAAKRRKAHLRSRGPQQSLHDSCVSSHPRCLHCFTSFIYLIRSFVPLSERSSTSGRKKPSSLVTDDMVRDYLLLDISSCRCEFT